MTYYHSFPVLKESTFLYMSLMTSKAQNSKVMKLIVKKDNKIEINNEALNMLRSIDNYLAICVCIGPYRQGKSFLLNKISGNSNEFPVGHKDDPCTEGVWINKHSKEFNDNDGNKFSMVLMDTEVIFS
jgi:hypothetical protein